MKIIGRFIDNNDAMEIKDLAEAEIELSVEELFAQLPIDVIQYLYYEHISESKADQPKPTCEHECKCDYPAWGFIKSGNEYLKTELCGICGRKFPKDFPVEESASIDSKVWEEIKKPIFITNYKDKIYKLKQADLNLSEPKPERIEGVKCVKEFLQDEVVGLVNFSDHIFVATKHGLYCYPPDMEIVNADEDNH